MTKKKNTNSEELKFALNEQSEHRKRIADQRHASIRAFTELTNDMHERAANTLLRVLSSLDESEKIS